MDPRVGVGVFLFNATGQFIIGQRKNSHGAGTLALPGGHLEYGESFEACAARETLEETGLVVDEKDISFFTTTNDVMPGGKHYVTVFVGGRVHGEPTVTEPHKCEGWQWATWEDLQAFDKDRLFQPLVDLMLQRPDFQPQMTKS
ncbi:hypothetical protein ASPZODRAFT_65423 [Penicilliopsis zonata CBS 506.65]|uniref:Nudix hydrolase domain-containing protein n=1 Tax=Penicilliopsis zonata CBS 506.65 TaxID=1073090 RepID=A0A1L9SJJ8_9EURO|nr:hypothetical protein ASPZODRAFT_65423 [Penicilliopsis zonata CBS 506.65]OJJ47335.1 hypothetical protein ASPZODRAFT_65423 [Penicilliopsis zonata CBS 506.65]